MRQSAYTLGRLATYSFAGAVAGFAGNRLSKQALPLIDAQASLSIAAGLLLITQGLKAAGFAMPWTRRPGAVGASPCLAGGALKTFLTGPGLTNVFLAGLLTGFLPCGLVDACLALAGASNSAGSGLLTMAVFGAGTAPLMIVTGFGGTLATINLRRRLLRAAAWCVVLTGVLSVARGSLALSRADHRTAPNCPLCAPKEPA